MSVGVRVPGTLRQLTAGEAEVEGSAVVDALRDLERRHHSFVATPYEPGGCLGHFLDV
ncbi:MAG: hypothetical protein ACREN1_07325 [Candidatus Dormibacteria bacterium]